MSRAPRNCIYRLGERAEEQCHPAPDWLQQAIGRELCAECKSIKGDWYPRLLRVRARPAPRRVLYVRLWWTGIDVFRRDLIECLEPFLEDYIIGPCEDESGQIVPSYVTCYTDRRIIIRGDKYCTYNQCQTCGACWVGRRRNDFVLGRDVVRGAVFQDWRCSLFLNAAAGEAVLARVKGVRLSPITIIRRPLDGARLPGDPDWSSDK